ncbi:TPA: ead/Ea22-like family protein [Escherichia coli]|nr:ead/Ea22-like family protein [Escherichia coli]
MTIDYQALREAAERAIPAMERLLMLPVDDDLLTEQELKDYGVDIDALNAFKFLTGPETVLALLDERERNQQYIKRRDQENEDIALTVGKLRVELEAAEKRIAELESLMVPQLPQQAVPDEIPEPDTARMFFTDAVVAIAKVQGWNACRAAMLQSGNFRENKNSSTNNFREIAETSTNYPVIPSEVLSAIREVAKIRADFDDFDGDRRGIGDCLDEVEQELIVTINKYASQLAAEPIATNNVREQQTAVPPVPEIQDDVAQAIENLKQKLVECNRYNYCADAVKGVEDACHAAMLQGSQPVSQTYKLPVNTPCQDAPAHIWLQTAGVWPEDGELSELTWCSHNQHHDDTLYVRADLVNGNSPVTPDGWISCSERMPAQDDWILIYSKHGEYMAGQVQGEYVELSDGTLSWLGNALFWMLLPEPPQEAGQ